VITLGAHEARVLAAFGKRQLAWDPSLAARIVSSSKAIGVYTAPPMDVLSFTSVPAKEIPALDLTVTLASLVDALEAGANSGGTLDVAQMDPAPASWVAGVSMLPPSHGWQIPMYAVAGDLVADVDAARQEFISRSQGLDPRAQQDIADEIWNRIAWAGLPMRMLHAAKRLGLLAGDQARVAAATCGTWRRFSTPLGEIFHRIPGETARFEIHVVR
jgi:hypothetical protein